MTAPPLWQAGTLEGGPNMVALARPLTNTRPATTYEIQMRIALIRQAKEYDGTI